VRSQRYVEHPLLPSLAERGDRLTKGYRRVVDQDVDGPTISRDGFDQRPPIIWVGEVGDNRNI
jgi:hypothetical protein